MVSAMQFPIAALESPRHGRTFWQIVRGMGCLRCTITAPALVAIIDQVQVASWGPHPANKSPLAETAQQAARDLIDTFPAPAAAVLSRGWMPSGTTEAFQLDETAAFSPAADELRRVAVELTPRLALSVGSRLIFAAGVLAVRNGLLWLRDHLREKRRATRD